ncbi:18511_t:CDS:10 [Entrophospora sp. SA101]|nr:18511_t:CDS:10 [Entrophospora sp. SA101]
MKAIQIKQTGGLEVLEHVDLPIPQLKNPEDILVKNKYIGTTLPAILGREGSGVVESVGNSVKDIKPGDRVVYIGSSSYSEYSIVNDKFTMKMPDEIDFKVGCASIIQGLTALTLVSESYQVKKGDWVLVHAAAGGTGSLIVQFCKGSGATVIGTVSTEEKGQVVKSLGVDHVINYKIQNVVEEVNKLTNGVGVDVVYDGVGKDTFDDSLACCKRLASLITFGNASGKIPPFDVLRLAEKNIRLMRPTLFNYLVTKKEFQKYTKEVFEFIISGKVHINIWNVYKLSDAKKAHEDLEKKQTVLDHNTSLIRTIEDLQQSGPNISIVGIHSRSSGSNFPQDVSELVEEYTRVKAEQKCYKIKIQKLEDQIKDLEHTKERLMDSIKFIKGVNIRMKSQAHLLSTELENERNLHNELSNYIKSNNLSKNLSNDDIQGISAQKLLNLEKESSKLKMDNEMITKELKNVEEKLETANKELYSYRLQKSEIEYQKKTLEDTNKLLETRLNLKETECQSYKQVSDQTSKLNKQIQALLTKADVDRTVMSAEVDKLKTELDSTKNTLSELQKDYTKGSNDLHVTKEKAESSYNEVQLLKKANEELEKKYNQTQEKLINAQAKNENLKEQLSDLSERYSNANLKWTEENQKLVDSSKQANSKVVELQTEIEELKKKVELQSNELKQSQEKLTVYEQNEQGALINKLSHDLDSANEEINVLNKGMDVLKNSLETLEIISNNTKQDYEHLKDTLEKERAEFQSRSEDFDKKDEEFQRMKNELSIINQGLTEVTIEKEQLEKTLSDLHNKSKEDETLLRLEIQKHIDIEFYLQQVEKYKAQLELLQKTADELKESLNKVTKELNLVENDRNWWRERFHVVLEKHGISDPDELEQTKEKLKKSEGEKDTLMKEKDVLMREKDALIKEKDALKVERDAIKAENSRLRIDVANFKKQITDSKKQIDDLNKEILQSKKTDQTTTKNFQTLKGQVSL